MRNAMTIDVEDYFQVSAFGAGISHRNRGIGLPCRVARNMDLDPRVMLAESGVVKATFFTLGWVAQRYPEQVGASLQRGTNTEHSHGFNRRAADQSREFRQMSMPIRRRNCWKISPV